MRPIRNAAKALIVIHERLLVIQKRDAHGWYYTLPGGGQRPGETLAQTVRRECQEELGTRIEVGRLCFVREYIGKHHEFATAHHDIHAIEFIFACSVSEQYAGGTGTDPDEGQLGIAWLPLDALDDYRLYPAAIKPYLTHRAIGETTHYLGDVN